MTAAILWAVAAVLVIAGLVQLFHGQLVTGAARVFLGCLIGPGGTGLLGSGRA